MKINNAYNIEEIIDAIKYYLDKTNRRVTFEYILLDGTKLRQFRKVPEITTSLILNDIKLLELINNKYVPVIDKNTKDILFSEEEFFRLRSKMSGLKDYGCGDYVFSDNLYFDGIEYYLVSDVMSQDELLDIAEFDSSSDLPVRIIFKAAK